MRARAFALLVPVAVLSTACGGPGEPSVRVGDLELDRIVAPEPVTGERTAVYLRIRSRGAADTLTAVDAGAAGRASLHQSRRTGGSMAMGPVDGVAVPPGGAVELRPGGYHGMVEELGRPLAAGDTLRVTLRFALAGEVEVPVRVVPYAALDSIFGGPGQR